MFTLEEILVFEDKVDLRLYCVDVDGPILDRVPDARIVNVQFHLKTRGSQCWIERVRADVRRRDRLEPVA